jgi:uncharacterized Zn-binding protein involved in type VI secretion
MPAIARGAGSGDTVASPDGSGVCSASPSTQYTLECSTNVFVGGFGVVRFGDKMNIHLYPGPCDTPHQPVMNSRCSTTVFVNAKAAAAVTSKYGGDHPISSGSPTVSIGL